MNKKEIRNYVAEGLLIIFSVFLALIMDNLRDEIKTNSKKEVALERIDKELELNRSVVHRWILNQNETLERSNAILNNKNDTLRNLLLKNEYIDYTLIRNNKSLVDRILPNTAWEAAKSTQIISEFEFEKVEKLTKIYDHQAYIHDYTINKTVDLFAEIELKDERDFNYKISKLKIQMEELISQEKALIVLIDQFQQTEK